MILNLNQMRAFYTAAKLKSITLAAQQLMVTPPAISMQVKKLEEKLEIKLMFREGNSINLTEIGKVLFGECDKVFKQIMEVESFLEDISRARLGVLKIGCPQVPAKYIMPRLIRMFKKEYPGITVVIDEGDNPEMIENIVTSKNELAIMRSSPNDRRLKVKVFGREELVLIAAPNSRHVPTEKISIAQLSSIPMIVPKIGAATREVITEYLRKFDVPPLVVLESGSADLIKEMVREDLGVAFLVKSAVNKELNDNTLAVISILEGSPIMEYGFGYLTRKSLSPAAWAFLGILDKLDFKVVSLERQSRHE